ncbi:MAG: LysE family translocator [Candidatus Methanospirareceae archaeon]
MLYLFLLGFIIGLSGVLIPGPLLIYTISESLRRGLIGHIIISAHILIEAVIIIVLLIGGKVIITSPIAQKVIGMVGGVALLSFGIYYIFHPVRVENGKEVLSRSFAPFLGGFAFTAFNPSFPLWWITIGIPVYFKSFTIGGVVGVLVMMLGHWSADFGWYFFVSYFTYKTRRFLSERIYKVLMLVMGGLLLFMGLYFLFSTFYRN